MLKLCLQCNKLAQLFDSNLFTCPHVTMLRLQEIKTSESRKNGSEENNLNVSREAILTIYVASKPHRAVPASLLPPSLCSCSQRKCLASISACLLSPLLVRAAETALCLPCCASLIPKPSCVKAKGKFHLSGICSALGSHGKIT